MNALDHSGCLKIVDQFPHLTPVLCRKYQLRPAGRRNPNLRILVDIPIRMPGNGNRCLPASDIGLNPAYQNRCPEHRPVQKSPNRTVWALPHFFESIFLHPVRIRCNRCALDRHAIFFCRLRRQNGNLIVRLIPLFESQIIILRLQLDIRQQQLLLDHLPENSCHFIAVHLDKRCFHLNSIHGLLLVFEKLYHDPRVKSIEIRTKQK